MKITVVTPSFNQGSFIGKCLNSVRSQRGDFLVEHIILDNCSNDGTGEVIAEYAADHGLVELRTFIEADDGQTSAINKGFSLATGDVVCWLNTDEWYVEGALQHVAGYFEAHPEVDVVFGDCQFASVDGAPMRRKREYFFSWEALNNAQFAQPGESGCA